MWKRRTNRKKRYILLVAFALGLLCAIVCPIKVLLAILSIALIILGLVCSIC